MIDSIIHEETHQRIWTRAAMGDQRALNLLADIELEEAYVENVAGRFLRSHGLQIDRVRPPVPYVGRVGIQP